VDECSSGLCIERGISKIQTKWRGVLKMAKITSVKELVKELANFDLNVTEEKMTEVINEALRVCPESAELAWRYMGELLGYERLERH
jgi:hypothetical protein